MKFAFLALLLFSSISYADVCKDAHLEFILLNEKIIDKAHRLELLAKYEPKSEEIAELQKQIYHHLIVRNKLLACDQ